MTTAARTSEPIHLRLPAGGVLRGHLSYSGQGPLDGAVLYVHGFGSVRGGEKAQALEAVCARRGLTYAAIDFRGHGESSGTLLELRGSGLLEDLEAFRDSLASRGVKQLFPVGSSMGGWATPWFISRHPELVPVCVLIAPALDFLRAHWERLTPPQREAWKQTGRLRMRTSWVDAEIGYGLVEEIIQFPLETLAASWRTPLLIFHGMQDDTVPYQHSLRFVQAVTFPDVELRLLRGGDHRLTGWKEEMAEAACAFFTRHGLTTAVS